LLAVASMDSYLQGTEGAVEVFELEQGQVVRSFSAMSASVAFSQTTPLLVFTDRGALRLWNYAEPEGGLATIEPAGPVFALSSDGRLLASGMIDRQITV